MGALLVILGLLGAGGAGYYVARKTDEKAKTEADAIKLCMEMAKEGKVSPDFCEKFRDPSLTEAIAEVTENASKLAITGGLLYAGSHLYKAIKGRK